MNSVMSEHESAALVAEMFDHFCSATTMRQILGLYRNMCDIIGVRAGPINEFYPKFKASIRNWKAQAMWKKFDARASHKVYNKGTACNGTRVLVIGAGPCGLRTAIEAQLLGAKVVVIEKRDRISRNNVLHLWPYLITDLKALGAKKFYGKFCAGSIDHISIRQLQCILMKVALLLGVELHEGVSYLNLAEPKDGCGWRANISPEDHAVSHYEFDVIVGADGKRNTLEGFRRKEFRGKLAIAITANFINKRTEAETKVEEISGVAFIFNQSFFKELYQTTGIDLENIVYYKDDTHYFVMTAKKHSLLDKGVIMHDCSDPAELLSSANVDASKLLDYAREAAEFSTKYQMTNLEFAVNHYGKPDVAMFDFTSMFAADNSCRMTVRKNYRLLSCLVGDSLLEPFWPTGSGCARGFLSSMDAAYAIKLFSNTKNSSLAVIAQRESIYRLLAQTTPENLHRDIGSYTLDPSTRYPNLNKASVHIPQIKHLLDTDDPALLEQTHLDTNIITSTSETMLKRKRRTVDTAPLGTVLLRWIRSQLKDSEFIQSISDVHQCFTSGRVLCALINRYRPDLVDLTAVANLSTEEANEFAFNIFEQELGIPRALTSKESIHLEKTDSKIWLNYLEQVVEMFRGEIPHVKHPKLDYAELKQPTQKTTKMEEFAQLQRFALNKRAAEASWGRKVVEDKRASNAQESPAGRRARKRRSHEKAGGMNIDRSREVAYPYPRGAQDGQFSDRIKSMEQQITSKGVSGSDKKPKDLLRAIGKIDSSDWNVKEIEKKIELSKKTADVGKSKEKVPKWSREQFLARQNKLTQQDDVANEKFKEFDSTLKNVDKQLKEGHNLDLGERGRNKVASIAGQFKPKAEEGTPKVHRSSKPGIVLSSKGLSEKCHFCKQRVYLMEKISAEGLTLHRSCLKCHHCHTNLRLGGYAFDRDNPEGRFYCTQHFKLPPKSFKSNARKSAPRTPHADTQRQAAPGTPDKQNGVAALDLLDRGQTPERIEFENAEDMSEGEPGQEEIDENEWTDRNFGTESDNSDEETTSSSDDDSESDSDIFEDPVGSPLGAQTLQLASDWIDKRYSNMIDSDDEFYEYSSEDDDADSQTEGEEFARAREMRMQEVKVMPPPTLPTDTETDGQSDLESSSEEVNSATEISTDSEFDQDPVCKEPPKIFIDDSHLRKLLPTKVHVRQGVIENNKNRYGQPFRQNQFQSKERDIHLEFKPLVEVDPTIKLATTRAPLQNPRPGDYLLAKTASTEGIASKMSLELKKRYLLGETGPPGVLKSGSTSALDSKLKSFHSNITECQKLLHPAPEISPTMQTFLKNTTKLTDINTKLGILKKELTNQNGNEKENVYDGNVNAKNEINLEKSGKDFNKMSPTTPNNKVIETIDLITPDKKERENGHKDEIVKDTLEKEKEEILKNKPLFIDLTADTHIQDRSLVETTLNFSYSPITQITTNEEIVKANIPDLISSVSTNKKNSPVVEEERSRSPAHETTIAVPKLPWTVSNVEDMESDSLSGTSSSSSTSSVEDIPHFILDSTTSPETQNGERFVPRLEVRDTTGELMQIDSLMIINGKYVGDPEDLKVSEKLPEGTQIPSLNVNVDDECKDSIVVVDVMNEPDDDDDDEDTNKDRNSNSENESEKKLIISENSENSSKKNECDTSSSGSKNGTGPPIKNRPYEATFSARKPPSELKFDTKNENKIQTLKNMPFIIEKDKEIEKPKTLPIGPKETFKMEESDGEKTPMATIGKELEVSDSETEITGQNLTETELSDWNAEDAVSENFVDIEFALNSNKGTIKRNKKAKQKRLIAQQKAVKTLCENDNNNQRSQIQPTEHGIIKNLDIEDIEFMDTGSEEESLREAYSTTNKAMLKNRGYVEFVDTHSHHHHHSHVVNHHHHNHNVNNYRQSSSYTIIQPKLVEAINKQVPRVDYIEQGACLLNNDCDLKTPMNEELPKIAFEIKAPVSNLPLIGGRPAVSGASDPQTDSLNDIEEDSLQIVTSSPQVTTEESETATIQENVAMPQKIEEVKNIDEKVEIPIFRRQESQEKDEDKNRRLSVQKEKVEDIGYEEYVKRLQHKIAQISNARDSLEVKKNRRKSSKGELLDSSISSAEPSKPLTVFEPESVGKKIEEITKERVKQKDIIHDLVMDKLQTKKQLNAEKRLNRSRNRSNFLGASSGGNCENYPHYHPVPPERTKKPTTSNGEIARTLTGSVGRTLSNNIPTEKLKKSEAIIEKSPSEPTKLIKAQSFTYSTMKFSDFKENIGFSTPIPPPRTNRKADEALTMTEKLRQDARSRAKMKSNQDLGLSPEDRMLLLRKKYHISMHSADDHNKSDDIKFREQKLMSSKSVNDVSRVNPDIELKVTKETKLQDYTSDPNLTSQGQEEENVHLRNRTNVKDPDRRKSIIEKVSDFFNKKKESSVESSPTKDHGVFGRFKISSKAKDKSKDKEGSPYYERCASEDCLKNNNVNVGGNGIGKTNESSPNSRNLDDDDDDVVPPPIPPLPLNYQRSDDESCTTNESRNEIKKLRAMSKASRQGELKRLRIAQEIQREQEEIEVQIKELELRGVDIEKKLRGEVDKAPNESSFGVDDELLLKELLDIMNNITSLKVRDDELSIRQQELQLEHRHAQLKEELNMRLSCSKLDKNSSDVAAEGAILNEMLEIVAKRQALRPSLSSESRESTQLHYAKDTDV